MSHPVCSSTPYAAIVRGMLQRYLSLIDRNPLSSTYGCADRTYWHYRSLTDFPSAVYQQGVLAVAHLASEAAEDFPIDKKVLTEVAQSLLRFWARIQHPDGSFAEYYENQPSFCATAFTAFAASGAMLELRKAEADDFDESSCVRLALKRAVEWLMAHPNTESGNQMAASLAALQNLHTLEGEIWRTPFQRQLDLFLSLQTEEGWWPEYGGGDIGYSFKVLDLIAHVLRYRRVDSLEDAARKLAKWLGWFMHPDGTAGGIYGHRNNPHVLPFGMEWFALRGEESCAWMRSIYRRGLERGTGFHPLAVDEKYLAYFYLNSFTFAATQGSGIAGSHPGGEPAWRSGLPTEGGSDLRLKWWPLSGLAVLEGMGWYLICALSRGGVMVGYQGDRRVLSDAGWVFELEDGSVWSTQAQGREVEVRPGDHTVELRCTARARRFSKVPPLQRWAIPFRLFCKTVMRVPSLAWRVERMIRGGQVRARESDIALVERSIHVSADRIRICDTLKRRTRRRVVKAVIASDLVHPHGHCTRVLESFNTSPNTVLTPEQVAEINSRGFLSLERTLEKDLTGFASQLAGVETTPL